MNKSAMLDTAKKCVTGDREQSYGRAENNFATIAKLWNEYCSAKGMDVQFSSKDVAAMMILMKISRIASGHGKDDNWVDIAGYAACGSEIEFPDGVNAMPTLDNLEIRYEGFIK